MSQIMGKLIEGSDVTAISVWLTVDPYPSSSLVVVIEISPHWPGSTNGLTPFPEFPCFFRSGIHVAYIVAVLKISELCVDTVVVLTESISCLIWVNVVSSNWRSDYKNTSSPSVVVSSVWVLIGDHQGRVTIEWSIDSFVVKDT